MLDFAPTRPLVNVYINRGGVSGQLQFPESSAHLPLPKTNIVTLSKMLLKRWVRGGVSGKSSIDRKRY